MAYSGMYTAQPKKKKSHTQTSRTTASFDDGPFSPYLFSCRVSIILSFYDGRIVLLCKVFSIGKIQSGVDVSTL